MKAIFTRYKMIVFLICAIVINFASIYCYFYFGLHYFVPKYTPAIMAGVIGFMLLKKNWIANLGFATAIIIFCLPLLSQQYVISRVLIIFQFIEVLIIYNGGFAAILLLIGMRKRQVNIKKSVPIIINIALTIFLTASGMLSKLTNTYTADMYANKNYSDGSFKRVSNGEFLKSGPHGHYFFTYQNNEGNKLIIETEGVYVFYDSIKGNG